MREYDYEHEHEHENGLALMPIDAPISATPRQAHRPRLTIWQIGRHLFARRELLWLLTLREVQTRYRGSRLGIGWAFLVPLLMVMIYAVVFSVIFRPQWPESSGGIFDFALILFTGMAAFSVFAESITRAPTLIAANRNYVKKVVFPVDILPLPVIASALLHAGISLAVVVAGVLLTRGRVPWTVIFVPLLLVPLVVLTLGVCWVLAALGVFIRDLASLMSVLVQALFFLTPIVYPMSAVPSPLRLALWVNPLTAIVEDLRRTVLWGMTPNWIALAITTGASVLILWAGHAWFMALRDGFADVV